MRKAEMLAEGIRYPSKGIYYIYNKIRLKNINKVRSKRWVSKNSLNSEDYLKDIEEELYEEARCYSERLENKLKYKYQGINTTDFNNNASVGGGAAHDVLYFYTRFLKPDTVVETGVSAGWSSRAILDGLEKNKHGKLISNDLPYSNRSFKFDPEYINQDEIGVLVDDELKTRWKLYIGSDENNLPEIVSSVDSIDIFHYDSDKSYSGREFAMQKIRPKLHESSIVIMDDISDNLFFKQFITEKDVEYIVLNTKTRSKEVGIIQGCW